MDFTLQLSRDNTANSYYNVDLFPEQQLDYDLDFYDSLEIDKVRLPFFTKIRIPLTNRNKGSDVFDFDPFTSLSTDFPKDDFYFKITVYGSSSNTEISGILNVVSFEYNSSESYVEVDLKDFLSKYLSGMKDIKLGTLYGEANSYYRNRHTFAQFLQTTSNGGEAGVIGQNPDYTRPISFPYVDFCNDVDGKFGYAARQFLEYGPGLKRTGIMPVFSVSKFLEYIGLYLNTASFPVSVESKLFGLGQYATNPAFPDFQAEKLHMVVPSQLLAKQDVNVRRFSLRQSPAWAGTNTNLDSCIEIDGTAMEIHTDWWGSMETAGNYGTINDADPIYTVQQWGAEKQMGFYPYDFTNGIDEDGIRGFFCPKVSFNADITLPSSSVTIRDLQYEIPVIQRDKMVKDIILSDPDTTMTFKLYVGIYADGTMKKKIPLQDSNGDDIVLDTTGATVSQGYSEKGNYQQSEPQYRKCNTGASNPVDVAIIDNGATWADKIDFPDIDVNFPSGQEIFVDSGSEYSINYFLEPLDGNLKIEYVGAYFFTGVWWREFGITPPEVFGVGDIKKAITRIGTPDGIGDYALLNVNFRSNADTFIYKTDDEFSIEDSVNQTSPLTVSDILPAVLKRFDCGLFYEFSNGVNILRVDPLSIVRDGNQDINSLVDDLKSVKITNGGDKAKTLNINNKNYNLYFDDLDNDDITIGSTTQNVNTEGIAELKINLNSSIYYKSVCGEESGEYNELTNYETFSAAQLGFTENIFTPNKDVGLRFAYLDKPLYKTNMLVPYSTLEGFYQDSDMKTESQIIFSNIDLSPLSTNIGGQHIFNGRLFHFNTAGWNLMFEDLDGNTTQSYTRLFQTSEKILQSQNPRIEFDMVVPTVQLASLDFFLQTLEATRFTQNNILVKSAKGQVFDDYAYLTIEGILQ
jgi:hypothetical protein